MASPLPPRDGVAEATNSARRSAIAAAGLVEPVEHPHVALDFPALSACGGSFEQGRQPFGLASECPQPLQCSPVDAAQQPERRRQLCCGLGRDIRIPRRPQNLVDKARRGIAQPTCLNHAQRDRMLGDALAQSLPVVPVEAPQPIGDPIGVADDEVEPVRTILAPPVLPIVGPPAMFRDFAAAQEFEPDRMKIRLELSEKPVEGWLRPAEVKARRAAPATGRERGARRAAHRGAMRRGRQPHRQPGQDQRQLHQMTREKRSRRWSPCR